MSVFTNIFKRNTPQPTETIKEERGLFDGLGLNYSTSTSYSNSKAMKLSTVYACTNLLSNSVALLPIKIVKYVNGRKIEIANHPLQRLLNLTPNNRYNKFNFFKLLIESVILNGNGYIYISRDEKLNVKSLELIDPAYVTPLPQEDGTVKYLVSGMKAAVDAVNMIHIFQHCDEMFNGISVIKYASMALRGAYDREESSDNFYSRGLGLLGVLKSSAPLTADQKKQIAESWEKSMARTSQGGVAILPQGLDFQAISVSPEDAELLESRQYDVVSLCRFFNVSPLKVFDYSHMSYSSLEQVSLSYLQDSVLPYTQLMEDEFNRKLFKPSEVGEYGIDFDFTAIVQADKKAEADYYRQLLVNGILSINEVRDKMGYSPIEEDYGAQHWIQISYATADAIASGAYIKGQDQGQNQKVDNKVKQDEE